LLDLWLRPNKGKNFKKKPCYVAMTDGPSRKKYRSGRKETAVKVYTVNQESRYLIVSNVPAYGCVDELLKLFSLYGPIDEYRMLDDVPCEPYTEVVWIRFLTLTAARWAKKKYDDRPFYGRQLNVEYALQYETRDDLRHKLEERRRAVLVRLDPKRRLREDEDPVPDMPAAVPPHLLPFAPPDTPHYHPTSIHLLPPPHIYEPPNLYSSQPAPPRPNHTNALAPPPPPPPALAQPPCHPAPCRAIPPPCLAAASRAPPWPSLPPASVPPCGPLLPLPRPAAAPALPVNRVPPVACPVPAEAAQASRVVAATTGSSGAGPGGARNTRRRI